MHNIKDIRKNLENFKESMKLRNVDLDLENILLLDEKIFFFNKRSITIILFFNLVGKLIIFS